MTGKPTQGAGVPTTEGAITLTAADLAVVGDVSRQIGWEACADAMAAAGQTTPDASTDLWMPATKVIDTMCLDDRPAMHSLGRLLRLDDDRHVERADDGTCDSCAGAWPCQTRRVVVGVVECFIGVLVSEWP
jgi:hypothetical protein